MMVRLAFLILGVLTMAASGCCGPRACGGGCSSGGCSTGAVSSCGAGACRGGACCGGPLAALRNARKQLICGSGCGEAYVGEWISTPPDCSDPCCNDQFVGGAVKARPFSGVRRNGLLGGLYGTRACSGNESSAACGCGETSCDSCAGDYVVSDQVVTSGYSEVIPAGVQEGGCGCSTCRSSSPMASRLANSGAGSSSRSITARARYNQATQRAHEIRR